MMKPTKKKWFRIFFSFLLFFLAYFLFAKNVVAAEPTGCTMNFWRGDYGIYNPAYGWIGAWYDGRYFNATVGECTGSSTERYCIGWRESKDGCVNPDNLSYANGGNFTWPELAPGTLGSTWCITAWVREKDAFNQCLGTGVYPSTGLLNLWSSGHRIESLTYTSAYEPLFDRWTIFYRGRLSGNAFPGEYVGFRRKDNSFSFCKGLLLDSNKDFMCSLSVTGSENLKDYFGSELCVLVADSRTSSNCIFVGPTPAIPTLAPTGVLPTVTVTTTPTVTPTPTIGASFSCRVLPSSANVVPFDSVSIKAVDATGSSNLRMVNNTWPPPSCGGLSYLPDGSPYATFYAPGNVGLFCSQDARAERTVGGVPTGETADCTPGVYTVTETIYCCGSVNLCRACMVGESPSNSCAGKGIGIWCGIGGGGLGVELEFLSLTPSLCSGSAGDTCTFTAEARATVPFDFRFGVRPSGSIIAYTALDNTVYNGGGVPIADNYNSDLLTNPAYDDSIKFSPPYSGDKYLKTVEAYVVPVIQGDGGCPGGVVYMAILASDKKTILAETNATSGSCTNPTWTAFNFTIEPRLSPGTDYYLAMMTKISDEKINWGSRVYWVGGMEYHILTRRFTFRQVDDSPLGGFPPENTPVVENRCSESVEKGVNGYYDKTCEVSYTLPEAGTSTEFKIGGEVRTIGQYTYNCGGIPNGCWQGYFTDGGAVLGTVTVSNSAWWQGANGGNIYGYGGVNSKISSTATSPYLIDGVSGIAGSGTMTLDTNGQDVSLSKWFITNYGLAGLDSPDINGYSYAFFNNKLKDRLTQTIGLGDSKLDNLLANLGGSPNPSVTLVNTNVTISSSGGYDGGTAVVLVNGDLNINTNLPVGESSALAFFVRGKITINPMVTRLDGVYFAQSDFSSGVSSNQLVGNGSWLVSGEGKFILGRDLGIANSSTPAEKVNFMPKYLILLNNLLGRQDYVWQEVPG